MLAHAVIKLLNVTQLAPTRVEFWSRLTDLLIAFPLQMAFQATTGEGSTYIVLRHPVAGVLLVTLKGVGLQTLHECNEPSNKLTTGRQRTRVRLKGVAAGT